MGVLSEISILVKKAQIFPNIYPDETYRKGADNIARAGKSFIDSARRGFPEVDEYVTRAAMTVPGALGGLFVGANEADRNYGWSSFTDWGKFKDSLKTIGRGFVEGAKTGWREAPYADARLEQSLSNVANEFVPGVVDMFSENAGNNVRRFQDRFTPLGSWRDYATRRVDQERPGFLARTYGKDFADEHERFNSDLKAFQADLGDGNISESDPRYPDLVKRMEDLQRRGEELAKDPRLADLQTGDAIAGYSEMALNLAGGVKSLGALSKGVGAAGRMAKATRIGRMAPRTVGAASKVPSYALGWHMYGGPQAVDAAKDWWKSRQELEDARRGKQTSIPSWGQYASPTNTVSSVSSHVN